MQMHQHAANKHVIKPAIFPSPLRQAICASDKAAAATHLQVAGKWRLSSALAKSSQHVQNYRSDW